MLKKLAELFGNKFIDFSIASVVLICCMVEILAELGFHEIEEIGGHHGLAVFAIQHLFLTIDRIMDKTKRINVALGSVSNLK